MITFDHNNKSITGAVGTTRENVLEYLTTLKKDDGNPPETNQDVIDIIMEDIKRHKPEAIVVMAQGLTDRPFSFVEQYGGRLAIPLKILHMTHHKATEIAETLLDHYDSSKELIELLIIGTIMAITEKVK